MGFTFLDKESLREQVLKVLAEQMRTAQRSAQVAHEAATHSEMKAENKYDTRGLEAAYLAEAQSNRSGELQTSFAQIQNVPLKNFADEDLSIGMGALVSLDREGAFFILPAGGGIEIQWKNKTVKVLTPGSPLGASLIGLYTGDLVESGGYQGQEVVEVL